MVIIMNTTKQRSGEMLVGSLVKAKGKADDSLGFEENPVSSVSVSSVLPKGKRAVHIHTSLSSNARKGMRYRAKLSEIPKKLLIEESNFKRRLWTIEEDQAITSLVEQHGMRKWTLISKKLQEKFHIYGRSGKQCRERLAFILQIGGTII